MSTKAGSAVVACPRCGKAVEWVPENRFRPFCSERCRQIDLGAWSAGEYRVPSVEEPEDPGAAPGANQDD